MIPLLFYQVSKKRKGGPEIFQLIKLSMKKIYHFQFPSFSLRFRLDWIPNSSSKPVSRLLIRQVVSAESNQPLTALADLGVCSVFPPKGGPKTAGGNTKRPMIFWGLSFYISTPSCGNFRSVKKLGNEGMYRHATPKAPTNGD